MTAESTAGNAAGNLGGAFSTGIENVLLLPAVITIRPEINSNDFGGFLELIRRFEFEFECRRGNYFFEGFEFLVCSCECAVACLCPRNSISNVVVSVTIHDDMYKYMYIFFM